jgi:hypothetical protein
MTDKFGKEICEGDIVYFAFSETGRVNVGRVVELSDNWAQVLTDFSTTPFTVRKELMIRSNRNNNN